MSCGKAQWTNWCFFGDLIVKTYLTLWITRPTSSNIVTAHQYYRQLIHAEQPVRWDIHSLRPFRRRHLIQLTAAESSSEHAAGGIGNTMANSDRNRHHLTSHLCPHWNTWNVDTDNSSTRRCNTKGTSESRKSCLSEERLAVFPTWTSDPYTRNQSARDVHWRLRQQHRSRSFSWYQVRTRPGATC